MASIPPMEHSCDVFCVFFSQELSYKVFAYLRGGPLPRTKIYFSDNGGFAFQSLASEKLVSGWGRRVKSVE